jgi:hypothetical protein
VSIPGRAHLRIGPEMSRNYFAIITRSSHSVFPATNLTPLRGLQFERLLHLVWTLSAS